jgi:hypothetical protein
MTRLRQEVLVDAFGHLRRCGAGRRECVVYLTGPAGDPELIDGVVHPRHAAGPAGYDLDSAAIGELWGELLESQRSIRMQAHTHPSAAYHSTRDDALAIVSTPGFLSLVIPDFAQGEVDLDGAFLAERTTDGRWVQIAIDERLAVIP